MEPRYRCRWRRRQQLRHRRGGAAGGAAGTRPVSQGLRPGRNNCFHRMSHGELVHIGLAENNSPIPVELIDQGGVIGWYELSSMRDPQLVRMPIGIAKNVLVGDGYAGQCGGFPAAIRSSAAAAAAASTAVSSTVMKLL